MPQPGTPEDYKGEDCYIDYANNVAQNFFVAEPLPSVQETCL